MPTTINSIAADANSLYLALANDLDVELGLPPLVLETDFSIVDDTSLPEVTPLTIAELTDGTVDGTGVFDALMKAVNAHLITQFDRNRITGADYAKVYLGSIQAVMQFGTQFLLSRDRARLENLQLLETIKLAQAQRTKAAAEVQLVRAQIQNAQFENLALQLKAYTSRNEYAGSKMNLVLGYNGVLEAEGKQNLINAQYETQHAQVHDTLPDGSAVGGVVKTEKTMKDLQGQLVGEQYELARSQVRDTLSTGGVFGGITAVDKDVKLAQKTLVLEQVDSARAQTKDTLTDGTAVTGVVAVEKLLKTNQGKLVLEQYESQRGQTRGTLSTGETVVGLLGAQTQLYQQQITSYKRDAEAKGLKMILDTWTARKTIDDGVAVPTTIDTPAITTMVTNYRANLNI